jgi:hypothetical protein
MHRAGVGSGDGNQLHAAVRASALVGGDDFGVHRAVRAALIYQHKTQGADRMIADRLEALIQSHRDTAGDAGQPSS